jgi:hypothetical protein
MYGFKYNVTNEHLDSGGKVCDFTSGGTGFHF